MKYISINYDFECLNPYEEKVEHAKTEHIKLRKILTKIILCWLNACSGKLLD
jgi:hypothetical protein